MIAVVVGSGWRGEHRGDYFRPFLPQDPNPWLSHRDSEEVLAMDAKALPGALCSAIRGSVYSLWESPGPGDAQGP